MKVVHTKFPVLRYKAATISPANFIWFITWSFNVYLALLIVYRSDGMWIKSISVFAKPDVSFQHDLLLVLEKSHPSPGKLVYSTFPHLNKFLSTSNFRIPRISNYETDDDEDGLLDQLNLEIQMPLQPNEEITGVFIVVFFDWRLRSDKSSKKKFRMESTAVVDYKSNTPGSALSVSGDLKFRQKDLLKEDFVHLDPESDMRGTFVKSLQSIDSLPFFYKVLQDYFDRSNFSTSLTEGTFSWTNGRDVSFDGFKMKTTINYPAQEMVFRPGFWYNIKWAFIQLCPTFLVIYFLMECIRKVIFEQHMISTIQSIE